jgi:hypothetical protein
MCWDLTPLRAGSRLWFSLSMFWLSVATNVAETARSTDQSPRSKAKRFLHVSGAVARLVCMNPLTQGVKKLLVVEFVVIMAASGGLPGGGGSTGVGGSTSGFGHVGNAGRCYQQLARMLVRAGEVRDAVEQDQYNIGKYVKEIASLLVDLVQAAGNMFEEEHMRMNNMVTSVHPGGLGRGARPPRGTMEYEVIQNSRATG